MYGPTTQTLRNLYHPPCAGADKTITLNGGGRVTVRLAIVDAVKALDAVLRKYGYKARVVDTGAYNCRKITGGNGYSLHAYKIAIDINWRTNPYGRRLITDMPAAMVAEIKAIRTKSGAQVWRWGGDYTTNKDAMHFEIICTPQDLASGIRGNAKPAPLIVKAGSKKELVIWVQTFCNGLRALRKGKTGKPGKLIEVDGVWSPDGETQAAVIELQKGILAFQRFIKVPRTQQVRTDGIFDQKCWDAAVALFAIRDKL